MKKNILLTTLLAVVLCLTAGAQSGKLQRADQYYSQLAFSQAIPLYLEILTETPDNSYAEFKLANAYRLINQPESAVLWFEKAGKSGLGEPINNLYFGQALIEVGRYDEAVGAFEKFLSWFPGDSRGIQGIKSAKEAGYMANRPAIYEVSNSFPFNTEYAEFSPAYAKDGLTFTSDRKTALKIDYTYSWTGTPFLDAFYSKNDGQGGLSSPSLMNNNANTVYHDGNVSYSPNGKMLAFTRNQFEPNIIGGKTSESKQDGVVKLKIMMATYNEAKGRWNDAKDLNITTPEYSFAHPCFSPDSKVLYFASDIPNGVGGTDIWKAEITGEALVSTPVNLGTEINTKGQELFPYIDNNGFLYYSSNTLPGLGGLDIFRASYNSENQYSNPFNIGAPLNSSRDDFAMALNGNIGYLSSNRPGGKGSDDIYAIKVSGIYFQLQVLDAANNLPIENAMVTVSKNDVAGDKGTTNANGMFNYPMAIDKSYNLTVVAPYYNNGELTVSTANADPGATISETIKLICNLNSVVKGFVRDKQSGFPLRNTVVTLKNEITGEIETTITDITGAYRFNICANTEYTVSAEKEGKTVSKGFNTKGMTERTDKLINLEFEGIESPCSLEFNNIYFDFDKSNIREDASSDLENMFTILTESPDLRVEIGAHTDSRANGMYNELLSERRAAAVVKYLKKRGIKRKRMIAKGYGESKLKNNCADDVECSEEEHQQNRRVEFKLIDKNNKVLCESKSL